VESQKLKFLTKNDIFMAIFLLQIQLFNEKISLLCKYYRKGYKYYMVHNVYFLKWYANFFWFIWWYAVEKSLGTLSLTLPNLAKPSLA
jgi:hypothetical protein